MSLGDQLKAECIPANSIIASRGNGMVVVGGKNKFVFFLCVHFILYNQCRNEIAIAEMSHGSWNHFVKHICWSEKWSNMYDASVCSEINLLTSRWSCYSTMNVFCHFLNGDHVEQWMLFQAFWPKLKGRCVCNTHHIYRLWVWPW